MDWKQYFVQGIELLFLGFGTYFDIKTKRLPLWFLVLFGILGIVCNMMWKYQPLMELLCGCMEGLVFLLIGRLTKEAIGYGDGLGILILGIFEGWNGSIKILFAAFLLSGIYGIGQMLGFGAGSKDRLCFYPFLFCGFLGGLAV